MQPTCWGPCSPSRPCPPARDERSRAPGVAGPVVWAGTQPGPPLGRPPSALRSCLKTNRPGNCGGQQARRVAAHARPSCIRVARTHKVPCLGRQLCWSPGCLGSGVEKGSGPRGEKSPNSRPHQTLEGGWLDGVGGGGLPSNRRGKDKDVVLWAWLSAGGRGRAAREQPGAGLSPERAREEAEAVPEALAAMGGGVWEGDAPPSPRGQLRRRPGPALGSLRGNMALPGSSLVCAALTGGAARQTQCLLWAASVGGGGCQGEGSRPTCREAHTEEEILLPLGEL